MPEAAEEFTALLARARGGDHDALANLIARYESKVRLVARVLLGPALRPYLDSLDLVQSVHKSLLHGLRAGNFDLPTPESLIALVLTLVRRKVAHQWRDLQRQRRLDGSPTATDSLANVLTSLSSPGDDPAKTAQFNDQVGHLCTSLNEAERRLLEMRVQGYTLDEVAQELRLTPVALRVRATRLRQRLRAAGVLDDWL